MWEVSGLNPLCQSGYRSGDISRYNTPVWVGSGSGPEYQSGNTSGDMKLSYPSVGGWWFISYYSVTVHAYRKEVFCNIITTVFVVVVH